MQSENKVRHKKNPQTVHLSADFSCLPSALYTDACPKGRGLCALEQGDVVGRAGLDHLLGPYAGLNFADVRSAE